MFIAALLAIAEIWKQPKCLSIKMDKEDIRSTHIHILTTQFDRKIEENVFIIEKNICNRMILRHKITKSCLL